MEIDKSKFYLVGINDLMHGSHEMAASMVEQVHGVLEEAGIRNLTIPLGLKAQDIISLDESLGKDLIEIIQKYKSSKSEEPNQDIKAPNMRRFKKHFLVN
jgi:transcriptional regulatory protein LevR